VLEALGVPAAAAQRAVGAVAARSLPSTADSWKPSERPGTAPAAPLLRQAAKDGNTFFHAVVMPFVEDRVYVECAGAKGLLLAYLGSVASARFFARDAGAFKTLHALCIKGLRAIQERLEGVYRREGLAKALGTIGSDDDVPERSSGGRQDDPDLLPTFPEIHGYGPTATFYEDDYIDALQMLSCALDDAFYRHVETALGGIDCKLRHPPIKNRTRMRNKLGDPDDHLGKARPRPAHNIDTMRCAATFADAKSLTSGYRALVDAFGTPVRVKNSFREGFDPSKSYGYRSVMLNLRFDTGVTFEDVFGAHRGEAGNGADWDVIAESQVSRETGLAMQRILHEWFRHEAVRPVRISMAAEVQLILAPYLQARKESHLLYKVARCSGAEALVSDAAARFGTGGSAGRSALEAATRRMQARAAELVELRLPAREFMFSFDTIDLEDLDDSSKRVVRVEGLEDIFNTISQANG